MSGRLFYIVGPSGSGKDSLIDYVRTRVAPGVMFAKRTITRPASAGGEAHVPVTQEEFDALLASGAFAMHWRANGHSYGIGREIRRWLDAGRTVVVNGSREHVPEAVRGFPQLEIVSVTASPEALRTRLAGRAREDKEEIEARLARAKALELPPGRAAHEIFNGGQIAQAGSRLLALLS